MSTSDLWLTYIALACVSIVLAPAYVAALLENDEGKSYYPYGWMLMWAALGLSLFALVITVVKKVSKQ